MSVTVTNETVYVHDGEVVSELIADEYGEIDVLSGGTLTDSLATNEGMIFVDPGAIILRTSATEQGYICVDGNATDLAAEASGEFDIFMGGTLDTGLVKSAGIGIVYSGGTADNVTILDGGRFLNCGTIQNTNVMSGGSFTVQGEAANTADTNVLDGGVMRITEAGNATGTTLNGGSLDILSGFASQTVVSGGVMRVSTGTATDTILNDGELAVSAGTANMTVLNGGTMQVVSSSTVFGTIANAGQFTMDGGTLTDTTIFGGSASLTGTAVTNIEIGSGGTVTMDSGSTLGGFADFISGASITIDGTIAFDTAFSTAKAAQINGFSVATIDANTVYTLTDAAGVKGIYRLASDAAGFNSGIEFAGETLTVGGEPVMIEDLAYSLSIIGSDLVLRIGEKPAPKCDIDGNGISEVMFQHTGGEGGEGQVGFWMNGTNEWKSTNTPHAADKKILGAYDMDANGNADTVIVSTGVLPVGGIDIPTYEISYYVDSEDTDANLVNISCLGNPGQVVWANDIGNLTGNERKNSIVWHSTENGFLGAWIDGTDQWVDLGCGYYSDWEMIGCGDFSGDGKDSVVMSYRNGSTYYIVTIDDEAELGYTATELTAGADDNWSISAIGDFSGDGKDDVIAFNSVYGLLAMWGDGDAVNQWSLLGQIDANDWFVVGAGDYNSDGMDDLLLRQNSTGMLGYYKSAVFDQWTELGRGVDMNWTVIA